MIEESFVDILNLWFNDKMFNVHTTIPGIVESYNKTTRKAKVLPLIKPKKKLKDESIQTLEIKPIDDVPVIIFSYNDFSFDIELQKGDGLLLLFSEVSLGNYLNSSGKIAVDSDDISRFTLQDCIAIPGLYPFSNVPNNTVNKITIDKTSITISSQVGTIKIENSGNITFNSGTEAFVLGNSLDNWIINQLIVWATTHTHPIPTGNSGTSTQPLIAPINYLSNNIKGK